MALPVLGMVHEGLILQECTRFGFAFFLEGGCRVCKGLVYRVIYTGLYNLIQGFMGFTWRMMGLTYSTETKAGTAVLCAGLCTGLGIL